ncbi:hypothetical protein [Halapricum salinum]|uniref:Uncharacterized protein n=1 Tax=Halapricum salinum TaxID=1457250 RepID=A0A4D6H9S0_9EURY|nr:hypothetical protein [Halapricum salinum]QCC50814.1 hypothetical protein DV733_05955 [Halapricum salinum]
MEGGPNALTRVGAWGQLAAITLASVGWVVGSTAVLYLACGGFLLVTVAGIAGIVEAESIPVHGPVIYPFVVPGFVPLYHFAMQL